jgi:hypothetical protein
MPRQFQCGQSLVEFAISSIVLVLLFGGLVDLTRAMRFSDTLHAAAYQGARHGAWKGLCQTPASPAPGCVAGGTGDPYLDDDDIKSAVDDNLTAGGLPASVLKAGIVSGGALTVNGAGCLAPTDGNTVNNPPFATSAYPTVSNQPWLYICLQNGSGSEPQDLEVILLMTYGPLSGFLPTGPIPAGFEVAANWHVKVPQ